MNTETLTISDNRAGKKYEIPIWQGTIRAMDLRQIKAGQEGRKTRSTDRCP